MRKCLICEEPATVVFGADPDLQGVPACDQCKANVRMFMAVLWAFGEKKAEAFLTNLKKKITKENPI